jgi:DNA-binding transcriptional MerR regulator
VEQQERGFVSIGGVASRLGVTTTAVRKFEQQGLIPRGQRLEGSLSRIWPIDDVEQMQSRIAERRAKRKEVTTTEA